jgi:hypothetical protein
MQTVDVRLQTKIERGNDKDYELMRRRAIFIKPYDFVDSGFEQADRIEMESTACIFGEKNQNLSQVSCMDYTFSGISTLEINNFTFTCFVSQTL